MTGTPTRPGAKETRETAGSTSSTASKARDARLAYFDFLQWLQKANTTVPGLESAEALAASPDPLLAADACYAAGRFEQSGALFLAVARDETRPLAQRLDAWSGLLDTGLPRDAQPLGSYLLDLLRVARRDGRISEAELHRLAHWMGWELCRPLQRLYNLPGSLLPPGTRRPPAPRWRPEMYDWTAYRTLLTRIVALDPGFMLREDARYAGRSLRLPLAITHLLLHEPDAAAEILLRAVEYRIPPPPGGWKHYDGTLMPDAFTPRVSTTPRLHDLPPTLEELFAALRALPAVAGALPPFTAALAREVVAGMDGADLTPGQVTSRAQLLVFCLKAHAIAQDPPALSDQDPRPPRPPDPAAFAVLDAALRAALAREAFVPGSAILWQQGFLPALLIVRDPALVEGHADLLVTAMDRYRAVTGKADEVATSAAILANAIDNYKYPPRPDLQPYARRLREQYPKP